MIFSENWLKACDAADPEAFSELIDSECVCIRHQSGKDITREEMVMMESHMSVAMSLSSCLQ